MDEALSNICLALSTTPERWARLAQAMPDELLRRRPRAAEWSALECLAHLVDTEAVFQFRIACFLAGRDFPGFNPDAEGSNASGQAGTALAETLGRRRQESLKTLEALAAADLERGARHAELGPVTLRQMLHEWAAHDLMHTVQAERALMQPFIEESGAWKRYFVEHWMGEQ